MCLCIPCYIIISLLTLIYLYRNNISDKAYLTDLRDSSLVLDLWYPDDVDHLLDLFGNTFRYIVDEHAPIKTQANLRRPLLPLYNENIQAAKRDRMYHDRLWSKTNLFVHYEMFKVSKLLVTNIIVSAKSEYYNKKIKASKEYQRTIFSVVNKVLQNVKLSFQMILTHIKIWLIVLITSSVQIY